MGSRALAHIDAREAVIMPTHVHLLMEPLGGHDLSRILQGIKGASAREINKLTGVTGTLWLDESYDHIVRSEKQYWRFVRYITENPTKDGLRDDEYWLYKGDARLSSVWIPGKGQCEGQTGMSAPPVTHASSTARQAIVPGWS